MSQAKKILVVEDELNLRELVRVRLEQSGYEVITASDGYAAIFQARKYKPDLIILDLMIPRMDGYTVCRTLKSTAELSNVPIIMFTARTSSDDIRRGMDMGADAYVVKPFKSEVLLVKIKELLEGKKVDSGTVPPEPAAAPTKEEQHRLERERVEEKSRDEAQARTQAAGEGQGASSTTEAQNAHWAETETKREEGKEQKGQEDSGQQNRNGLRRG